MKPARGRAHLSVHSGVFVRAPQTEGIKKLGDGENERESEVSVVLYVCFQQERGAVQCLH